MSQQIVQPPFPNPLQTPEDQVQATAQAIQQLTQTVNQNATSASVLAFLQSAQDASEHDITSPALIGSFNQTINSQGGLVCIDACINGVVSNGSYPGQIQLRIDGNTVLVMPTVWINGGGTNQIAFSCTIAWKAVLGQGQHTVALYGYMPDGGGTLKVNGGGTGFTSTFSIVEFPENVQTSQ